jgi:nicotinamide riboside kinase
MKTLTVSFFGGPGSGKSIFGSDIFAKLKWKGYLTELAGEYIKTKIWEGSYNMLDYQIYIFGKQYHITHRLLGKVNVIVTDSPYLLSVVYDKTQNKQFKDLVISEYSKLWTYNVFLERNIQIYEKDGRMQDLQGAIDIDNSIVALLNDNNIAYDRFPASQDSVDKIITQIDLLYSRNNC